MSRSARNRFGGVLGRCREREDVRNWCSSSARHWVCYLGVSFLVVYRMFFILCFSYMTSLKVLSLHFLATADNTLRKKASISSAFFFLRSDYISPGNPRSNLGPGTCLNSWLLTLGILQTYPLSESFMIDFLMPYIHRLIDQPPLNHNRQKLISCHCTSGSFQEKKSGPFLVWYFFPGPISCPGTLTSVC